MRIARGLLVTCALSFLACGGESETGSTDAGSGTGGTTGGTGGGATGGAGGTTGGAGGSTTGGGGTSSVCSLPQDPGPCDAAFRRWWFDSATGKCAPFIYGGCEGNGNNFQSAMECVGACAPGTENACTVIACASGGTCVYTSPENATCATPCSAGAACPPGTTCGCGASCSGCKDCVQVCVDVEG